MGLGEDGGGGGGRLQRHLTCECLLALFCMHIYTSCNAVSAVFVSWRCCLMYPWWCCRCGERAGDHPTVGGQHQAETAGRQAAHQGLWWGLRPKIWRHQRYVLFWPYKCLQVWMRKIWWLQRQVLSWAHKCSQVWMRKIWRHQRQVLFWPHKCLQV